MQYHKIKKTQKCFLPFVHRLNIYSQIKPFHLCRQHFHKFAKFRQNPINPINPILTIHSSAIVRYAKMFGFWRRNISSLGIELTSSSSEERPQIYLLTRVGTSFLGEFRAVCFKTVAEATELIGPKFVFSKVWEVFKKSSGSWFQTGSGLGAGVRWPPAGLV